MKTTLQVKSKEEGEAIVRGLADPVTRATVVMVGLLSGLSQTKRDRVIRNTQEALNDAAEDEEDEV